MSTSVTSEEFEATIAPALAHFEAKRAKCVSRFYSSALVIGLIAISALATVANRAVGHGPVPILIPLALGALAIWGAYAVFTSDYRKSYKRSVVGAVVATAGDDLRYEPELCVRKTAFKASKLFHSSIDRYRGEDHVSGTIGKTRIEFSEIHAQHRTQNGKNSSWQTIFKGVFIVVDFNKNFQGRTVVLPDTAERLFGFIGQKLQEMNFTRGELVKLEDPEFEREFCVYTDDQVEARYILSLSLMQRILEYKRKIGGNRIHLAFFASQVYIAIESSRNRFEPKVFSPADDLDTIRTFRADLDLILGVVEDLDLNTRIWSKE